MRLIHRRTLFAGAVFILFMAALLYRSFSLQILPQERLSRLKKDLFETKLKIKSRRGVIYDRNGKELAVSVSSLSLFADPSRMDRPKAAARRLSRLFSLGSAARLQKKLTDKQKRFVWIKRRLTDREARTVRSFRIKGLHFVPEPKRFYPRDKALAQTIGFVGVDGQGLEGIEKQYDSRLAATHKQYILKRDAKGRPLFADFTPLSDWFRGWNIYLTVDSDLQFYMQKELEKALKLSEGRRASGIIAAADTSEILALVNLPSYSLNRPLDFDRKLWRNRALTDSYEPGSTLKTFAVAAALKKGLSPTKTYRTKEGFLKIGGEIIREAETGKETKERMNMSEILAFSSNVGAGRLALDTGAEHLRRTFLDFGFNQKTGADFPGEVSGKIRPLKWRPIETVTAAFGYGLSVTSLQMVNAYTAIANGGILKQPLLVKEARNPYTGESHLFRAKVIRRSLTPKQAHILTLMLTSAVEEKGTGVSAAVPGYLSAGKTGTARMADLEKGGYKKEYIAGFAGFIPAHKPKFVIYIAIEGAKKNFYGSEAAAPVFSKVASYAVRRAGLSPVVVNEKDFLVRRSKAETDRLSEARLVEGRTQSAADSFVLVEENRANRDGEKRLRFLAGAKPKDIVATGTVLEGKTPDFRGLSLRQALSAARGLGILSLKIKGSRRVIKSLPEAGEPLPKNKTITLILN